jgi:hypothetical protein
MTVNPDLAFLLDQTTKVFRPTEATVDMVTQENLALNSTGLACHIQAVNRDDIARGYGYQDVGSHWAFYQSTAPVQRGDLVQPKDGPWTGQNFWVRGPADDTDVAWIDHLCMKLEFTDEST